MHLLVLRQKQRQGTRIFKHRAQQRDLEIGIGPTLRGQSLDLGRAAVEARAVERCQHDDKRHRREQQPGAPRAPGEQFGRQGQGSGRALQHAAFVHDFAQSTIRPMPIAARGSRKCWLVGRKKSTESMQALRNGIWHARCNCIRSSREAVRSTAPGRSSFSIGAERRI